MKPRRDPPRPSPDIAALAAVRRLAGTAAMEGGLSAVWGGITGTLSAQADLAAALAAKLDDSQAGTFGLTLLGAVSQAAAKTSLAYTKGDVGLGSVDNTSDAAKNVLSATKLTTARTLAATGDVSWSGSFDGSANFSVTATIAAGAVTLAKMANMATASVFYRKTAGTGAPEVQTLATLKTDLGLTGTNSGDQTSVSGNAGTATKLATARTIAISGAVTGTATAFDGSANISIPITALDVGSATAGTLDLARGGTGATTAIAALSALRSGALVRKAADLTGANFSASSTLAWDQESFDDSGWHDNVTNNTRLSVPAGVSRVRVGCTIAMANVTASSPVTVSILKSGGGAYDGNGQCTVMTSTTTPRVNVTTMALVVGGTDYFEVNVFVNDTSADIIAASSNFWIEAA